MLVISRRRLTKNKTELMFKQSAFSFGCENTKLEWGFT